jgi:lipocalin
LPTLTTVHSPLSRRRKAIARLTIAATLVIAIMGCLGGAGVGPNAATPLRPVAKVNLDRFAGTWYVLESIGLGAEAGYDTTAIKKIPQRPLGERDDLP